MTDELLRERLREHADGAPDTPLDYEQIWELASNARRRRRGLVVLGAAGVVAAILVGGTIALDPGSSRHDGSTSGPTVPAPRDVLDAVRGLTGRDVGVALGLQSMPTDDKPCQAFAEYVNGSGFCVDGVSADPAVLDQIMEQIQDGDATSSTACAPMAPRLLVDASPAGDTRLLDADVPIYSWGTGDQEIRQQVGADPIGLIGLDAAYRLDGPGWRGYAIYVGDPGVGQLVFAFQVHGCTYTTWLPAGTTKAQAEHFATTY